MSGLPPIQHFPHAFQDRASLIDGTLCMSTLHRLVALDHREVHQALAEKGYARELREVQDFPAGGWPIQEARKGVVRINVVAHR
jgi:hypothetical protein